MACGAAVIATAVGGMQEIFESGREGMLVPRADAAAIRQALNMLDTDRSALARIACAGYAHAAATFSTRRVSEQYSQLYATLADRHA